MKSNDEKFQEALADSREKYKNLPSYKRTPQQIGELAQALTEFLWDFPSMRLGQTLRFITHDEFELGNIYDEEVVRRLNLFRQFQKDIAEERIDSYKTDWVTYLKENPPCEKT